MILTQKDIALLKAVHPDLRKVILRAAEITICNFRIGETARTVEQQKKNMAKGVSWTMHSRHIIAPDGLVYAADLLAIPKGVVVWQWFYYHQIDDAMKSAAKELRIPIEWGGDWVKTKDGPHFQLPWNEYPGTIGRVHNERSA